MSGEIIKVYVEYHDQDRAEFFIFPDLDNLRVVEFDVETEKEDVAIGDGSTSSECEYTVLSDIKWVDFEPSEEDKKAVIEAIKEVKDEEFQ